MNISNHFTLEEMTASNTARQKNISNQPDDTQLACLKALAAAVLDPLREAVGSPVTVSSGFRSDALNAAIPGSAKNSQHSLGQAADLQCDKMSALEMFKLVVRLDLPYDQVIYENKSATSKWVHVSYNAGANRGQIMLALFSPTGSVSYQVISKADALARTEPLPRSGVRGLGRPVVMTYEEGADEPDHDAVKAPKRAAKKVAKKAEVKKAAVKKVVKKTAAKKSAATAAAKAPAKKAAAKKAASKPAGKKAPAKKAPTKKVAAKKAAAKAAPSKKAAAKRAPAKAAPMKKAPAKKAVTAKIPVKKVVKKAAAKKRKA